MTSYEKLTVSLRYYLLGKGYYRSLEALEFGPKHHTGTRKDGVTPEFQHQIEIAHYIRTLEPSLQYPDETIAATLLHDVKEDYGVLLRYLRELCGDMVAEAVDLLDKNGKTSAVYFSGIAKNPIASIVKGGDRMHNIQSMVGVFSPEKQVRYVAEVHDYFLPMLKTARRNFPRQELAYENIKHIILSQLEFIEHIPK